MQSAIPKKPRTPEGYLVKELENDPHGLLEAGDQGTPQVIVSPLVSRFSQICDFIELHGRPPQPDAETLMEQQLAHWLSSILNRIDLVNLLIRSGWGDRIAEFQTNQTASQKKVPRLQDPFGLLGMVKGTGIQQLRHVSRVNRKPPESVARRQPCKNFSDYAPKFEEAFKAIESGQLRAINSTAGKIRAGVFLVMNDLLGYVDKVESERTDQKFNSGDRRREDGRTRVIFENATESDLLLRSLEKAVLSDGYILEHQAQEDAGETDAVAGFLYVVRSKRDFPGHHGEPFKIGFTRTSVQRRLAKARTEAAYLFGDVEVVASYRCLGVDPAALEGALHSFFDPGKLEIELDLGSGNILKPKEWFGVDIQDIDRAVFLALESELMHYSYDLVQGIQPRN